MLFGICRTQIAVLTESTYKTHTSNKNKFSWIVLGCLEACEVLALTLTEYELIKNSFSHVDYLNLEKNSTNQ